MTAVPSGVVTFLCTDIEGSTRRWETEPDAMRATLAAHDEVLRAAVDARGGWQFKNTGDGVWAPSRRHAPRSRRRSTRSAGLRCRHAWGS